MMDYEEFKNDLLDMVQERINEEGLEGISVKLETIQAPGGMSERLIAKVDGSNVAMAFKLAQIYDSANAPGHDISEDADSIVGIIKENLGGLDDKENAVKAIATDYSKAKDHLLLRLVPGDSPILDETPHREVADMALIVNVVLEGFTGDDGRSVAVISDKILAEYGVDEDTLFEDATKNSLENEPLIMMPLGNMLQNLMPDVEVPECEEASMCFVATTKSGLHGAACIGYPDFFEKAAEAMGGSFFVLPSSVHELILVKDTGAFKAKKLDQLIQNVNDTVLKPGDKLSDHCYHVDARTLELQDGVKFDKAKAKAVGAR